MNGGMMSNAPDIFMKEQQAKLEFVRAVSDLRSHFSSYNSSQFLPAFDALTEAALRFGTCELRMRRAERLDALGLAKPEVKGLKSTALTNNERGLAALTGVRPFIDELESTRSSPEELALWRNISSDLRAEWRDQISEVNVSAENALHLVRMMDECCEAIDQNGVAGLGRHLSATLAELEKQRRAPNRGIQEASFPWWKLVFVAGFFGIGVWALWNVANNGGGSWNFYLMAVCAVALIMLGVLGC
jgi:hypothetical protein